MSGEEMPKSIGEYTIMRPVAKGLMGTVYVGTTGDQVFHAVKVLDPSVAEKLPWANRFAGEIQGPRILDYKSIDVTTGDRTYFVSEYLEVKPISRQKMPGVSSAVIVEVFARLAETLQGIHDAGLAHGNVKSSNILVRRPDPAIQKAGRHPTADDIEVMFTDFGIKYKYDPFIMTPDMIERTFPYMSPERIKELLSGDRAKDALPKPAMDIYSLGVTLCEVLTGSLTYSDVETPEEILKKKKRRKYVVVGVTNPVRRLDLGRLNEVVAMCTAYDHGRRFASMSDFASSLRECVLEEQDLTVGR